ncbi:MAG: peptide-methionine (S)-S-oxide reductase MsrA [Thermoplasmata archaeon]|nr:peptide-methionine (S)-S-oxide reductase MsrA [Thermoplasmata archaeon]
MAGPQTGDGRNRIEVATFAAGCFWGTEVAYRNLPGVVSTEVGYSGGSTSNPSYREVCSGDTGHVECVRVLFDPEVTSYGRLLEVFWSIHDPCSLDRQGPDTGSQYRSVIFFHSIEQEREAAASRDRLEQDGNCGRGKVVTEIKPVAAFYRAEEYHQRYFEKKGVASSEHSCVCRPH